MKYIITDTFRIDTQPDGTFPLIQSNILAALMAGSRYHGIRDSDGSALMSQLSGEQWVIPGEGVTNEQREASEETSYYPLLDNFFMQALMLKYPMMINPVVSRNGYLLGRWRVDSVSILTSATSNDDYRAGVLAGKNEPVFCESDSLYLAVATNAFMQAGLNKRAIAYFGESENDPKLLFVTENTLKVLRDNQIVSAHVVEVAELNKYAFVPDMAVLDANYNDAMAVARERLIVQKSALE